MTVVSKEQKGKEQYELKDSDKGVLVDTDERDGK